MPSAISFSPQKANEHGGHAPTAAKDDVNRNGDVISEHEVVEEIDGEEEKNVRQPARQRDRPWLEEKGRVRCGEVGGPCDESRCDKLNEGDEKTYFEGKKIIRVSSVSAQEKEQLYRYEVPP